MLLLAHDVSKPATVASATAANEVAQPGSVSRGRLLPSQPATASAMAEISNCTAWPQALSGNRFLLPSPVTTAAGTTAPLATVTDVTGTPSGTGVGLVICFTYAFYYISSGAQECNRQAIRTGGNNVRQHRA